MEKRLFDAWGNVLVQDGNGTISNGLTILDRGYTGHEHLQSVGLINMNGRLYDSKLHRFLQPDNYVQDPSNTQNYNRYGYVLNNPLKYTDPSGESFWKSLASIVVSVAFSAVGIYVGIVTGGAIGWVGYVDFNSGDWQVYAGGWGTIGTIPAAGFVNFGQTDGQFSFYGGFTATPSFLNGSSKHKNDVNEIVYKPIEHPKANAEDTDLDSFSKERFGTDYKFNYGVKSLNWGSEIGNKVAGYYYDSDFKTIYGPNGPTGAITTPDRRIYVSDYLKGYSYSNLELTLGHEFIHSYQRMKFGASHNSSYSEFSAYEYTIKFLRQHNGDSDDIQKMIRIQSKYLNGGLKYNYNRIPGFENR